MGWDIQINPTAPAYGISPELVELIDAWAVDFDMKYCSVEPDPRFVGLLRVFRPRDESEREVVQQIIRALEAHEPVELLLGH